MAVTYTVSDAGVMGNMRWRSGTFTSAAGDGNGETLARATHGLRVIRDYALSLDPGAIATQNPKITLSGGTLTWTVDDTHGYNGRWYVLGV